MDMNSTRNLKALDTTSIVRRPVRNRKQVVECDSQIAESKAGQTACKPGSVLARKRWMAIPLGRPLPNASRDRPGRRRGNTAAGCPACRPYLVLLPVGFAVPLPLPVARWALTPPFHPCLARRTGPAVCSLWHFPWGRPRRTLSGTVSPWSPDFPRRTVARPAQPSSRLTRGAWLERSPHRVKKAGQQGAGLGIGNAVDPGRPEVALEGSDDIAPSARRRRRIAEALRAPPGHRPRAAAAPARGHSPMPASASVCQGKRRPGSILRLGAMSEWPTTLRGTMAGWRARMPWQSSISAAICAAG